jgi:hypothetical protein
MSQVNEQEAGAPVRSSRQRWYALAVCMTGGFIVFLDVSIIDRHRGSTSGITARHQTTGPTARRPGLARADGSRPRLTRGRGGRVDE